MNSRMINTAKVRRFALDYASRSRHHGFTRVSPEFFDRIDAKVREAIRYEIDNLPSKGKTIK